MTRDAVQRTGSSGTLKRGHRGGGTGLEEPEIQGEDFRNEGVRKAFSYSSKARVLQLLKPARLEPMLRNKRSHRNEKPAHGHEE